MSATGLAIIGTAEALAQPLARRTLELWEVCGDAPRIVSPEPREALEDPTCWLGVHAVWLHAMGVEGSLLDGLVELVQERHLPTLLTPSSANGPEMQGCLLPGIAICPAGADPATVLAMLRVCWAQAGAVRTLAREVQMLQVQHRGLCEQIDKIDQELRLASQMQREFLPGKLPSLHGVEFAAFFRPATYVSGDIYDIIPLDGRHVAFFLADAVGHGVPAAMMTVFIAQCLRTMALNWPATGTGPGALPAAAMGELNQQMMRQQSPKVRTATACFGLIDCQTRRLWFARAGQPSAILLRPGGDERLLEPEGGLLGVFPDGQFEVEEASLEDGQRLLVHSDGFEIAFRGLPSAQESGNARRLVNPEYAKQFASLIEGPVDKALLRLAATLDQQVGSLNQLDDLTAILIGAGAAHPQGESRGEGVMAGSTARA